MQTSGQGDSNDEARVPSAGEEAAARLKPWLRAHNALIEFVPEGECPNSGVKMMVSQTLADAIRALIAENEAMRKALSEHERTEATRIKELEEENLMLRGSMPPAVMKGWK